MYHLQIKKAIALSLTFQNDLQFEICRSSKLQNEVCSHIINKSNIISEIHYVITYFTVLSSGKDNKCHTISENILGYNTLHYPLLWKGLVLINPSTTKEIENH
jgi:hypothetical protein